MGKRGNAAFGKGDCGEFDPDVIYSIYKAIQVSRSRRAPSFYNSAISKHVVRACIVVEMGSHPTKRYNSFLDQRSRKVIVISQEPFLCSVRTLSSHAFRAASPSRSKE